MMRNAFVHEVKKPTVAVTPPVVLIPGEPALTAPNIPTPGVIIFPVTPRFPPNDPAPVVVIFPVPVISVLPPFVMNPPSQATELVVCICPDASIWPPTVSVAPNVALPLDVKFPVVGEILKVPLAKLIAPVTVRPFPPVSKPPKVPVPGVAMFPFGVMEVAPPFVK